MAASPGTEQIVSGGGTPQPTTSQLEALAYNSDNRVIAVGAAGVILLSLDQISSSEPIPFQSKWLLVFLLVGYAVYALNRPH